MNAYMFQAALLCEECATALNASLDLDRAIKDKTYTEDSDQWPQGPYPNGGGEADSPSHCDICGVFLENSLTSDGMECVRQCVATWAAVPADKRALGPATALTVWAPFYGVELP